MVQDMELAGLAKSTQAIYLSSVERFICDTWLSPEEAEEKHLADYLRQCSTNGAAKGTFKTARYGLVFLFQNTLGRNWPLFKKKSVLPSKSGSRKPIATKSVGSCSAR
jgi:hypothetical protein